MIDIISVLRKILPKINISVIKNEIKKINITFQMNVNSGNTINYQRIELTNENIDILDNKIESLLPGVKNQVTGKITTDEKLQKKLENFNRSKLESYFTAAISGTAAASAISPDFYNSGGTLFPDPEKYLDLDELIIRPALKQNPQGITISRIGANELKFETFPCPKCQERQQKEGGIFLCKDCRKALEPKE